MKRWLLIFLLACSCGPCCPCGDDCPCESAEVAQSLFAWSPGGKPYHANACVVKSSDGKCGSGVYLQYGGMVGVLTCQHVAGGKMSATFSDGKTLSGEHRTDKFGHDIAWIAVKHPTIEPLNLSAVAPKPGERVEFVSRGGPVSQLRHWYGTVESDGERLRVDANITPGDSGGTILNERGEVVGVSTDGAATATYVGGWVVYAGAGSPGYGPIRKFLQRLHTQFCPDGRCPPQYGDLYPPEQGEPPTPPTPLPIDDSALDELRQRIDQLEKSQRGPAGKDGRDGKDGVSPDPQAIADSIKLPSVEQIADAWHAKYGAKIVAEVKAQIPPLYVEVVDPSGKYSSPPQAIHFMQGEGLRLTLDPTQLVLPKAP